MTIQNVLAFQEIYPEIANIKLPFQTAYKLAKITQSLEQDYIFYQSSFNKILEEYALKDDRGNYQLSDDGTSIKIDPNKVQECSEKIEELQNISISDPVEFLSAQDLDGINLTLTLMNKLMPFIR